MIHVKKILYPTDFSSYSNQAYFHALGLAETYGASLTVAYVHAPGSTGDQSHWREQLEQVRPANPKIPVSHVLLEGDPAREIARYAADAGNRRDRDRHARPHGCGQARDGFGCGARHAQAPCSVLVVKLPKGVATAGAHAAKV